ncbi:ATP-binding protein [Kitasatospora sp. NPDC008050]|uniref:ATP-binding protein n=1 Tax=Kitasatospora sp. NPDC008050 TaxID=3364021 RepID=UPI0036EBD4F7
MVLRQSVGACRIARTLVLDVGAGPVSIGGARLRALVARLVLDGGRAVRPQVLVEALWGESPPADQGNALQSLVSRLRGVLGDPELLTLGPAGYRLAVEAGAVDAVGFEQLARSGRHLLAEGQAVEAADALREALSLWRGPALADAAVEILHRLTEVLADDDLVLVLDNCEHLVEAVAALAETLLGRCPRLRVLATSREALRIDGEILHPVLPLELPESGSTPAQARACAAVRLFHDRAVAVCPGFEAAGEALAAAIEICHRLDGLPLAIELAAARLRTLPVEVVAARLDDRFRLLTRGSRTALPRHQTLRAAVAWSWDLLHADERALLERLSVVPGSFTEDAAQEVGGLDVRCADAHACDLHIRDAHARDVRELLAALVDKSLLHPLGAAGTGEPRYQMLETIREYGLEQLARREEVGTARSRHAGFFLELAETAEPHLRTHDQLRWLARLSAERDNLLAAIGWAIETGDAGTAVRLAAALSWFWSMRDYPPESLDLLDRVLEVPGPADPVARALVVATHAVGTESTSRPPDRAAAFRRIEEAMAGIDPGVHPLLELAQLAAAIAGSDAPGAPDAMGAPDRERKDPSGRSFGLLVQGLLTLHTGNIAEATDYLSRALTGFEELGERWGLATALSTLGSIRRRSGELAQALAMNERATRYFQELGMQEYTVENEVQAALMRAQAGDVDGARRQLAGLFDQVARSGSAEPWALVGLGRAQLEWRAGQPQAARAHARVALAEAPGGRPIPSHLTALLLGVLAQVDAADGRPDEAVRRLDHPAVHLVLTWNSAVTGWIAVVAAGIELCRDRPSRAARLLGAADLLRGSDDLGDPDVRRITRRATAALGAAGFAAAHATGAAMSRTGARDLLSAIVTAGPGSDQPA